MSEFIWMSGFLPVAVPYRIDPQDCFDTHQPGGLCLTGGNNLSSVTPADHLSVERDQLEEALIDCALERELPIFGICRGMQLIAHRFGAKLIAQEGHVGLPHDIETSEGSLFRTVYGKKLIVNSFHKFCITDVDSSVFRVGAHHVRDQSIEAIEHREKSIIAVMWHPERNDPFESKDIQLFRSFFTQGKNR